MDLLDGLDDDGDGDVDNPIEIEARTASVLKPVEPDQSEQAQAAVAEEVTEGAKRKVRKERKSRSKSRSRQNAELALAPQTSEGPLIDVDRSISIASTAVTERSSRPRRKRSKDPEAEARRLQREEKYKEAGLSEKEILEKEAERRKRARSKSRKRKEEQIMAVALERSETVGENDDERRGRKDTERQKRREKRERSRNRNKEQTQLEPAAQILEEEPVAKVETTEEAPPETQEEIQSPQTEGDAAPPVPEPRTVINVQTDGEAESAKIETQFETQDPLDTQITEKIIEESAEKANKEEKLSENSDVMKTEIPSAPDSHEPNVSSAKEESEETAEAPKDDESVLAEVKEENEDESEIVSEEPAPTTLPPPPPPPLPPGVVAAPAPDTAGPPPPPPFPGTVANSEEAVDEEKTTEAVLEEGVIDEDPSATLDPTMIDDEEKSFNSDQEVNTGFDPDTFADADGLSVSEALTSRLNDEVNRVFSDKFSVPSMSRASSILSLAIEDPQPESHERKKRFGLFGKKDRSSSKKRERPSRLAEIYFAVRKGIGDYISINTAELNVLQTQRLNQENPSNELIETCSSLQHLLVRLQEHQEEIDTLYESYCEIDRDWREEKIKQPSAAMLQHEQDISSYLGEFSVKMKGLLGFSRLKAGDQYEVTLRYGKGQKWKSQGKVEKDGLNLKQSWTETDTFFRPTVGEFIAIKVTEARKIGKGVVVGNVSCETKDLFNSDMQQLDVELNEMGSLKLSIMVHWKPFVGEDIKPIGSAMLSEMAANVAGGLDIPPMIRDSDQISLAPTMTPSEMSTMRAPSIVDTEVAATSIAATSAIEIPDITDSVRDNDTFVDGQTGKGVGIADRIKGLENAGKPKDFMDEVRDSIDPRPPLFTSQFLASDLADIEQIEEKRQMEAAIGRRLMEATNQLNLALDDFRGRYKELRHLEESIQTLASIVRHGGRDQPSVPLPSENESAMDLDFINSDRATTTLSPSTVLGSTIAPLEDDQRTMITQSYRSCRTELFELDDDVPPTTGNPLIDEALIPHLQCCKNLLGNVGNYGPCRVNEIKAVTSLMRHGRTISRLIELSRSRVSFTLDSLKEYEFKYRPTLLMQWKSCCDNKTKLAVPVKTYKYELTGNYSSHVRKRPAVADQVFPELLRRILDRPDLTREEDLDNQIITVYQIIHYLEELKAEEQREFGKHVEMLSLELFISGELESGDEPSVLRAIGLLQSLLVRKHSNMKALAIMLLDENKKLRDAAAAHLRHIANEPGDGTWRPRDFALASYLELLEDKSKKLRRASCIALGFLNAKEALRQLQYVCMAGQEPEIREAAKNVLISFGSEGEKAYEDANATFLAQTMSHTAITLNRHHMGTAL